MTRANVRLHCVQLILACAIALSVAACTTHGGAVIKAEKRANETAARGAAENWLRLLDTGDYEEAFEWEAQDFRMFRTQQQFVRSMQARRAPFGHALGRSLIGSASIHKLVGVPDGDYQSLIFKTSFERKSPTAERVILVQQDVGWRVIDYRIY
jgi:hypothetical protein